MAQLSLTVSTGPLSPRRFSIREAVSHPFSVTVWACSPDPSLDLAAILDQPATFHVVAGYKYVLNMGERTWRGIVVDAEQAHALQPARGQKGLSTYFIRIVPELWRLTQRRGNRIFQHLSIPDIVDKLLAEWSIQKVWKVDRGQYPKLEYKVQYGESDYQFFCRLLEEAGIAFTFPEQEDGKLTFSDRLEANAPRPGEPVRFVDHPSPASEKEFVTNVRLSREVRPGAYVMRDYEFRNPAFELFGEAPKAGGFEDKNEQYYFDQGGFLVEGAKGGDTPVADDKGIARHDQKYGKGLAERGLHGDRVGVRGVNFECNTYDLAPGSVFSIGSHPHADLPASRELLVLETTFEGTATGAWGLTGRAVFAEAPYRPPRRTPKPIVSGFQSALVVGPKGQEIHTDEFGRVRVQFHWDREGKKDDSSLCWIRVNQGWGGMGYGMMVLPRIGQEVLVGFAEGDPDLPFVMGREFNAVQQVPYRLPEHKTRSTWKSDSSLGSNGFNEIMFEDLAKKELVWEQAEKDRTRLVKNDEFATVVHDRQKLVKRNESDHTDGNRQRWVGKNADEVTKKKKRERIDAGVSLHVKGDRQEQVDGKQSLTVVQDRQEEVTGRHALRAKKEVHWVAGETLVTEGGQDMTLRGPGGFFRIDSSGVTIKGLKVRINVSGKPRKGKGSKPQEPEEAALALTPSIVDLRWDKPKVAVGEPVKATFTVANLQGDETAIVTVFECNADGGRKAVDQIRAPVGKTDGDIEVEWARKPEQAEGDLQEDEAEGDVGPLEYRFEVGINKARSDEASGPLWLTNTVVVEIVEAGKPAKDGTTVTILTAEGARTATSRGGRAVFEEVLVGTLKVLLDDGCGSSKTAI